MVDKVPLMGYRCERCEHEWLPRGDKEPRVCPKCKSPYWDRPRQNGNNKNKAAEYSSYINKEVQTQTK